MNNVAWMVLLLLLLMAPTGWSAQPPQNNSGQQTPTQESSALHQDDEKGNGIPKFDGEAAYQDLVEICRIGPRISTSEGMAQQQALIQERMESLGGEVIYQPFNVNNPATGQQVELKNMIVRWQPERKKRLLFCCHYDTRPFADRDPINPRGQFIGANDGASGVALLLELAKSMPNLPGEWGIDMVFFDGEEFVYVHRRDPMFLGSTYFAENYAAGNHDVEYTYGILVDMVGDKHLELYYEKNSMGNSNGLRLMRSIWGVAKQMGRKEFTAKKRHKIRDDHLPLINIARIPTVDIIDFDYPTAESKNAYWHTTQDIPENCSAESLEAVGSVLQEWLLQMEMIR